MTERTIRMMAKEFAGEFYEQSSRSERFRRGEDLVMVTAVVQTEAGPREIAKRIPFKQAFPNAKAYVAASWPHWVAYAREKMVEMLAMSDERVPSVMKERIAAAIIEDREKQIKNPLDNNYLRQGRITR